MILAAGDGDGGTTSTALAELCENYWYPVFAFIRRSERSREDALDLTQGYFASLIETGLVRAADPDRGKFRSFMLTTVKQFLSDQRKHAAALKRGGAVAFVTLQAAEFEDARRADRAQDSPERAFERQWALTVFHRARRRLEKEFIDAGKRAQFLALQGTLSGGPAAKPYSEIATELGCSEGAVKMGAKRLRQRFGHFLRAEIAETLHDATDLDMEVRHLLSML